MSYRHGTEPDLALQQFLSSIARRLTTAERRVRWPGATQFVSATMTSVPNSFGVWTSLCSLTVDPGAWLVLAGLTVTATTPTFTSGYQMESRLRPFGILTGATISTGLLTPTAATSNSIGLQGVATFTAATAVSLETSYSTSLGGLPAASAVGIYLLAFPA